MTLTVLLKELLFSPTPALVPHCPPPCPRCLRKRRILQRSWTAPPAPPVRWVHTTSLFKVHIQLLAKSSTSIVHLALSRNSNSVLKIIIFFSVLLLIYQLIKWEHNVLFFNQTLSRFTSSQTEALLCGKEERWLMLLNWNVIFDLICGLVFWLWTRILVSSHKISFCWFLDILCVSECHLACLPSSISQQCHRSTDYSLVFDVFLLSV